MYQCEIVICKMWYIACYPVVNVLKFSVIFQVFVVCENGNWVRGTELEVIVMCQSSVDHQKLPVMDVIIAFSAVEHLRVKSNGHVFSPGVFLGEDCPCGEG